MAEVSYGHIAIVPKGVWSSETQYEVGHLVEHDGSSYVVKTRPPVGTLPTDESYWQLSAKGNTVATGNIAGVVKGSNDITVGENGELFVNTTFEQATELANLIAGEAIKEVFGKVSKTIATTMDLDQNALLKNMISGIDTNDGNKVPSSAFVHTLHERLGMGTALAAGDASNVTQAINKLYSNLGQSLYYKGEAVNTNNLETNGIYSLTPSTEMGTTGITANWGIVLCFGNPGYNHQNEWRWQRVFYTSTFRGGYRTKLNDGAWSSWSVL